MIGELDEGNQKTAVAAGLAMVAITAVQFVAARFSLRAHLTSADIASLRFAGAGVVFVPIMWRVGFVKMRALGWRRACILALLVGFPYPLIINSGLVYSPASHAAALCPASIVLFSFLLSRIVFKDPIPALRIIGIVMIIVGLLLFVSTAAGAKGDDVLYGDALFAVAGIMFSTYSVLLRRWSVDPLSATAAVAFLSCLPLPFVHFLAPTGLGAASVIEIGIQTVIQGFLAGAAAVFLYAYAVRQLGTQMASLFMPCIPITTALTGMVVLGEIPTTQQFVAIAIMTAGIALPWLKRQSAPAPRSAVDTR
ncbi:MAG: DMT family transporter [Proteobacteria bacterium]|nr:DMT family transporter [Pseudomonadota bacterium]